MDRYSYGGDDDGGVGEGCIMAERTEKGQHVRCRAAPAAGGGAGLLLRRPVIKGERRPLAPLLHGFLVL